MPFSDCLSACCAAPSSRAGSGKGPLAAPPVRGRAGFVAGAFAADAFAAGVAPARDGAGLSAAKIDVDRSIPAKSPTLTNSAEVIMENQPRPAETLQATVTVGGGVPLRT